MASSCTGHCSCCSSRWRPARAVCTASRAAFLSGCLSNRSSLQGVINPSSTTGISPDKWLLPEMFHDRGYATANFGKWCLGKPSEWDKLQSSSFALSGMEDIASCNGRHIASIGLSLFDLETDPGESVNVAARHPDIVARLSRLAEPMRADLGDTLPGVKPTDARPVGQAS